MEEEKRCLKRISFTSPVRYYQKGSEKYSNTVCKDLSASGIGFISNEFIPKGTQLLFELNPPWNNEPIQVLGEVKWIASQSYSERFNVGAVLLSSLNFVPI